MAGGLEIACWCDIRIAGEGAHLGCLERRWGVPLIDGGTQRLTHIVGLGRALDMILSGRIVEAREAMDDGAGEPRRRGRRCAGRRRWRWRSEIAAYPWACVLADRQAAYDGLGKPLDGGVDDRGGAGRAVIVEAQQGAMRFAGGEGRQRAGDVGDGRVGRGLAGLRGRVVFAMMDDGRLRVDLRAMQRRSGRADV